MQPVWLAKAKRTHPSAFLTDLGLAQLTERRYDISDDAVLEKLFSWIIFNSTAPPCGDHLQTRNK